MQDLNETTITDAVRAQMSRTADPRLCQIMDAAVRHLHNFAREVTLTPAEWLEGIKFLTAVGHASTPIRQEFILLSDVLGLSALINALHDNEAAELGTQTSLLGPFFREAAPEISLGGSIIANPCVPLVTMYGRVTDTTGRGIPGATVEIWQTDEHGLYDLQKDGGAQMDMRGRVRCDAAGNYHFRTVRPLGYSIPLDGPVGKLVQAQERHGFRPSHIHFLIAAPNHRELVTALYFGDDAHVESDTVFGVSASLIVCARDDDPNTPIPDLAAVQYDFRLGREASQGTGRVGADPAATVA
ncbi:MAG: hydroxyquinol 1,2-dioxygenase [Acetobacteraceae bacterium]|nr:hydroxyquinol 1,2-dioxygenase [Acetobacteraceae bacterium]MSP29712.1 hydroxyquinol 1,2-dioxygenase [Acetobacteraceae bacterium]